MEAAWKRWNAELKEPLWTDPPQPQSGKKPGAKQAGGKLPAGATAIVRGVHDATLALKPTEMQLQCSGHDPQITVGNIPPAAGPYTLELKMNSASAGYGEVFWVTTPEPKFVASQSVRFDAIHNGQWHDYAIALPVAQASVTFLRLDPCAAPGLVRIARLVLKDATGKVVKAWFGQPVSAAGKVAAAVGERPTIACYYFPNYHPGDPRNQQAHGKGWSEWELVKAARPRFPGHFQPNVPLWGYCDESDPQVMARKIDAAADHGVDVFLYDWYYYDDGPFLNRGLDLGYLKAGNNARVKFALMWANHDWINIHPYKRNAPRTVLYPGVVSPESFEKICDHVIAQYFSQPSYWRIDGKPYFSFYDLGKLMENFGSLPAAQAALERFRAKAKAAGLPGLHLNAVSWGRPVLPVEKVPADPAKLVKDLGFDSVSSYVWVHHVSFPKLQTDYDFARDKYLEYWDRAEQMFDVPYFPNVTMGWDPSPRTVQSEEYGNFGYPLTNTLAGNTPERFREALLKARQRLQERVAGPRVLTINAWNEWTEGSYLEPDEVHGLKYLEAIGEVFPPRTADRQSP
jgi:hypothetical protein